MSKHLAAGLRAHRKHALAAYAEYRLALVDWADTHNLSMQPVMGGGWCIEGDMPGCDGCDDPHEVRLAWIERGSLFEALEVASRHECAPRPLPTYCVLWTG